MKLMMNMLVDFNRILRKLKKFLLPYNSVNLNILWLLAWAATIFIFLVLFFHLFEDLIMSWIRDTDKVEAINTLSSNYIPSNSSGTSYSIFPFWNVIGGLLGGVGSLLGAQQTASAQRATNRLNYQMWQEQKDWSTEMQKYQNQWNADQWLKTFNMENNYNSAQAQMSRLAAAGINPFVAATDVAKVSSQSNLAPPQSGNVPPVASPPLMQNPYSQNMFGGFASSIAEIASAFKYIADAKKAGADTRRTETLLNAELENLQNNAESTRLLNELTLKYAGQKYEKEIQYLGAQILNTDRDTLQKWFEIGEVNARIHNIAQDTLGKRIANRLSQDTYESLVKLAEQNLKNAQEQQRVMEHQEQTLDAQAFQARQSGFASGAQASYYFEEAHTAREMRTGMLKLQDAQVALTQAQQYNIYYGIIDGLAHLGMDLKKFGPELNLLKIQIAQGKIKTAQDLYNLVSAPIKDAFGIIQGNAKAATGLLK